MLEDAHVLPDGRRVFRTRDGMRVMDKHGRAVAPKILAADQIDPSRPVWEDYKAGLDRRVALMDERRDLIEYQRRLDQMEDRIAKGGLSRDELSDLNDLLSREAPAAVRARLPESDSGSAARDPPATSEATMTQPDLADPAFDAILGATAPPSAPRS